jgi:hypothetical protein
VLSSKPWTAQYKQTTACWDQIANSMVDKAPHATGHRSRQRYEYLKKKCARSAAVRRCSTGVSGELDELEDQVMEALQLEEEHKVSSGWPFFVLLLCYFMLWCSLERGRSALRS